MSSLDTRAVHDGEPDPRIEGAVSLPIFQTATYTNDAENDEAVRYIRYNNSPNHEALHQKLASLESTEAALVTGSGMAAISSALLGLLNAGDHLVAPRALYGGTLDFFEDLLPRYNVGHSFLGDDPASWEDALTDDTTVLYAESITNPLLGVPDLEALAAFADDNDLVAVIDSTFASPVNLRPAEVGFDVVLHSGTKYLAGHSDLAAGVIAGSSAVLEPITYTLKLLGGMLDPHACFLLHRSLKTLGVRVRQQNQTAQAVAEALQSHPAVARVRYPGLDHHPDHERARRLLDGYGGMVSFDLAADASRSAFFDALTLPIRAPSLGGVETLVSQPVNTSHANMDPNAREALGITDRFVRLSVGLEGTDDLVDDLTSALNAAQSAG